MVTGLPKTFPLDVVCRGCMLGNHHQTHFDFGRAWNTLYNLTITLLTVDLTQGGLTTCNETGRKMCASVAIEHDNTLGGIVLRERGFDTLNYASKLVGL